MSEKRGKRKRTENDVTKLTKKGLARTSVDLMVLVARNKKQDNPSVRHLLHRWTEAGYTHVALVHTVYGRASEQDRASLALPESEYADFLETYKKKQNKPFHVLRRLHAVVENVADVGFYTANNPASAFLNDYDLISISPRNDAAFESVCNTATGIDILTLDYTAGRGGVQLPFRIRGSHIHAANRRGVTLEIPYSPAVLVRSTRKGWIQTSRELQVLKYPQQPPTVIMSSGSRIVDDADVGSLAVRVPGDLINVFHTVLGWDLAASNHALAENGLETIQRARQRRYGGGGCVVDVSIEMDDGEELEGASGQESDDEEEAGAKKNASVRLNGPDTDGQTKASKEPTEPTEDDSLGEDGFVAFS